jgi:8-oxo-dGTP diphosphatase
MANSVATDSQATARRRSRLTAPSEERDGPTHIVVVSVLIVRRGKVLLLRRSSGRAHAPGTWEPVSGRVRPDEPLSAAARREAQEETGIRARILAPVSTWVFRRGPKRTPAVGIAFLARARSGRVHLSSEHDAFCWTRLDRPACDLPPEVASCLRVAAASLRRDVRTGRKTGGSVP